MNLRAIISTIICFGAASFGIHTTAQQWGEVSDPHATRQVYFASAHQSKLWILDDGDAAQGLKAKSLRLKTWDNTQWVASYQVYTPNGVDSIHGQFAVGFDTSVYVSYLSYTGGLSRAGLLRFDIPGNKWTEISSLNSKLSFGSEIRTMAVFDGDIYLGGVLINSQGVNQLIRIKHVLAFAEVYGTVKGELNYLSEYQGSLYFGGSFDSIGSLAIRNLALYDEGVFTNYSIAAGKTAFLKSLKSGALLFQEERSPTSKFLNSISSDGDKVLNADFPIDFSIRDMDAEKGELFSLQYSSFGLYPAGVYHLNRSNNSWQEMHSVLDPMRSIFVNTGKSLYLIELSGNSKHIEQNGLAYLSGRVFVDIDGDCAKTAGDRMLEQAVVVKEMVRDKHWLALEGTGTFGGFESAGTYELELPSLPKNLSAQVCAWDNSILLKTGDSVHLDIPLSVIDTIAAVRISVTSPLGFRGRQGFEEEYTVQVYNEGFKYQVCPVYVRFPEYIQFTGADKMPDDSLGNGVYLWKVSIAPFQKLEINLKGSVFLYTPAYTKVRIDAWSDSACLRYDNLDSLPLTIVGAFDPNDKQNSPEGKITRKTEEIIYHIRFQNTGTDTAYRVTVIDTLDLSLPLMYFKLMRVSHPFTLDLTGGRQRFVFENIMLPDSNTDFDGSQGYITYKAKLKPTLKNGDSITNTAYIYFDYQHPIETNSVSNIILEEENNAIPIPFADEDDAYLIYPNPSKGQFQVVNFTTLESLCMVYDAQGKRLGTYTIAADGETPIDLSKLSPGIYFLKFPEWNAQESLIITN